MGNNEADDNLAIHHTSSYKINALSVDVRPGTAEDHIIVATVPCLVQSASWARTPSKIQEQFLLACCSCLLLLFYIKTFCSFLNTQYTYRVIHMYIGWLTKVYEGCIMVVKNNNNISSGMYVFINSMLKFNTVTLKLTAKIIIKKVQQP